METTNLPNLKINVLTPEQYETAEKNANELYLIGNDTTFLSTVTKEYVDSSKVTVDTALNASSTNPVANSAVAAALDAKQPTITGAASTIASSNLTAARVLVSNSSGKVAASSSITTTELGYLDGVTSKIQTQINNLSSSGAKIVSGTYTGNPLGANLENKYMTLTFNFTPKIVILHSGYGEIQGYVGSTSSQQGWGFSGFMICFGTGGSWSVNTGSSSSQNISYSFSNNTLTWTISNTLTPTSNIYHACFMKSGTTYNYIAIG